MNGYSYLEDTQELKLEPFREFYQTLAEAKLESFQNSIKLNEFIKPTKIIELNNIINQKLVEQSISEYPLVHYLIAVINTPSAYQANALKWAIFNTRCIELLDSKEHAATVANLCRRFRLASKKQEYHWLYNLLPPLPIELEDLLKFLNKAETENRELLNRTGFVGDFLFKLGLINYCGISVYLYHPTKLSIHFRSPAYTPSRQPDANVVDRLKNLIEKFPEQ